MRKFRLAIHISGWFLLALGTPGLAQLAEPEAASEEQDAEKWELAQEMSAIGFSDTAFDRQMEALPSQLVAGLMKDPGSAALELEYPGIVNFVVAALLPPLADGAKAGLPDIRNRLARIYADNLEKTELSNLLSFYRSPTGVKLVGNFLDNPDISPIVNETLEGDDDAEISQKSVSESIQATAESFVESGMTKADRIALIKFSLMPEFKKLSTINPIVLAEVTKWMNEPMPEAEALSEIQAIEAVAEYMDARDNEREPQLPTYIGKDE